MNFKLSVSDIITVRDETDDIAMKEMIVLHLLKPLWHEDKIPIS